MLQSLAQKGLVPDLYNLKMPILSFHVPVISSLHALLHAEWACLAQADRGAGAEKVLWRPTEPARLTYTPIMGYEHSLWQVLADAAAMASAFAEYPCTRKVEIEALHLTGFPSNSIGQARLAIFKKVTGSMAPQRIQ